MNARIATLLLAIVIAGPASLAAAATQFSMALNAQQEVPPTTSDGFGFGTMTLVDLGSGNFRWDFEIRISSNFDFRGFDQSLANNGTLVTGFHIHNAPRGANGAVVYGVHSPNHDHSGSIVAVLNPDNSTTFTGSWTPADGAVVGNINTFGPGLLAAPLGDVDFYWNVHTGEFPAGAIRGQIVAIPEPTGLGLLAAPAALALLRRRKAA